MQQSAPWTQSREKSPVSALAYSPWSVPSQTCSHGSDPEGRRATSPARHRDDRRQGRAASGRRGDEHDLRAGFSRLLVWISARPQRARRAGRPRARDPDKEGELRAGRRSCTRCSTNRMSHSRSIESKKPRNVRVEAEQQPLKGPIQVKLVGADASIGAGSRGAATRGSIDVGTSPQCCRRQGQ